MTRKNEAARDASAGEGRFSHVIHVADVILKLTPVVATIVTAWIAYDFQSRASGTSLLNQREQAETQLRASMFNNLIGPIAGPSKDKPLGADQQRLLVELLTLNFHEHVEFKPLLLNADKRLALELKPEKAADAARASLRSVVRRVLDRQLAVLQRECVTGSKAVHNTGAAANGVCDASTVLVRFCQRHTNAASPEPPEAAGDFDNCTTISDVGANLREVSSPDGKYSLSIAMLKADWKEQRFQVDTLWSEDSKPIDAAKFMLTPYDLPFTDNTIIDRDHRFALGIKDVVENTDCETQTQVGAQPKTVKCNILNAWVVWFPKSYILPHERPVNYQEIRHILKLDTAGD